MIRHLSKRFAFNIPACLIVYLWYKHRLLFDRWEYFHHLGMEFIFLSSEIIHQIKTCIHIKRKTCSHLFINCKSKVMFQLKRRLRIVLFLDELKKLKSNPNVLLAISQHLFGVLTKIFELNLVIGEAITPRFKTGSTLEALWYLRILFCVEIIKNLLGPNELCTNECVNNSSLKLCSIREKFLKYWDVIENNILTYQYICSSKMIDSSNTIGRPILKRLIFYDVMYDKAM